MGKDDVSNAVLALITTGAEHAAELVRGTFQHLTQLAGVVNTNLVHQHGGVGDDPGLIAALQTAAGTPRQGMANGGSTG